MTYTFPNLVAGKNNYKVRLHFAELYWNQSGKRSFNVSINGSRVLSNFDIYATAGAQYKAVVREFTVSNSDSQMTIALSTVINNASICGIEILPIPLSLTITPGNKTVHAGTAVTISALATGGSSPYLINFDNGMWSNTQNPISYTYYTDGMPNGSKVTYYCWVTDASGTRYTSPVYTLTILNP